MLYLSRVVRHCFVIVNKERKENFLDKRKKKLQRRPGIKNCAVYRDQHLTIQLTQHKVNRCWQDSNLCEETSLDF